MIDGPTSPNPELSAQLEAVAKKAAYEAGVTEERLQAEAAAKAKAKAEAKAKTEPKARPKPKADQQLPSIPANAPIPVK
jgi:hypothetical protein